MELNGRQILKRITDVNSDLIFFERERTISIITFAETSPT